MKLPFYDKKFTSLFIVSIIVVLLEVSAQVNDHWAIPMPYSVIVYGILVLAFGWEIIWSGLKAIARLNFGSVSLLMTIAVIGAFYLREYSEGAVVMILYVLGEALEDVGIDNSKSSLEALVDKAPRTATVQGVAEPVLINKVPVGSIIIVKPGDLLPLDGEIIAGNTSIDESAITGEPVAKTKTIGEKVFAGTLNQLGTIEVKTTKLSEDTTFSKIVKLTFQANANKSERQLFIQRFAKIYTPCILLVSLLLFCSMYFIVHKDLSFALNQSIAVLVIACPCALVISTPVCVYAAIGNASAKGAIIKGGKFLETLAEVKNVAMDKTRTITYGKPIVSDVFLLNGTDKEELLACSAGAEANSEHPLAQAIVSASKENGWQPHKTANYRSVLGKGAVADCQICKNEVIRVGTLDFIGEKESVTDKEKDIVNKISSEGKSSVVVSFGKGIAGIFGLADEIKPDSAAAVLELKHLGVETVMLSGDSKAAAEYTAKKAGIDRAFGGLLPEDKVKAVKSLPDVAMVGDGINDAPALAASMVGIAMGAAGSDVAIETANIALMNDKLSLVPYLIRLGRATVRQIKVNTFLAIFVKAFFLILAFLGFSNLVFAIIADVGVMIVVVLLGLRMRSFK